MKRRTAKNKEILAFSAFEKHLGRWGLKNRYRFIIVIFLLILFLTGKDSYGFQLFISRKTAFVVIGFLSFLILKIKFRSMLLFAILLLPVSLLLLIMGDAHDAEIVGNVVYGLLVIGVIKMLFRANILLSKTTV